MIGRLVVNGVELDLYQGVPFPLNFSIADIKEPNKRKRNYSKTVQLPGTQKNLSFFSSTYDLSLTTNGNTPNAGFGFDPTQRVEAQYYKGGVLVFDGLLQLNHVTIDGGDYAFDCTLYSNFIDIYAALDKVNVDELGWAEYNHPLDHSIVSNSWNTSVRQNGGDVSNFSGGNPQGFGYIYPYIEYGYSSGTTKSKAELMPHVYVKEVIDKMFRLMGASYTSTLLNSTLFKKLIYGFGGGEIPSYSPAELLLRKVQFTGTTSTSFSKAHNLSNQNAAGTTFLQFKPNRLVRSFKSGNFTPTIIVNGNSQYNQTQGYITIVKTGTYKISLTGQVRAQYSATTMSQTSDNSYLNVQLYVNEQFKSVYAIKSALDKILTLDGSFDITLNAGDVVEFRYFISGDVIYSVTDTNNIQELTVTYSQYSANVAFDMNCINKTLVDGDTVNIAKYLPPMKCSEFLASIIKMFNLYISDADINGVMKIETLADFYQATTTFEDWTQKVDHNMTQTIKPASTIEGKVYSFEWLKDEDYDNERYLNSYGVGYGNKKYQVQSTFQTGEKVYGVSFAQTLPVSKAGTTIIAPRIVQLDGTTIKPYKGKPRIYFYNGLKVGAWRLTNIVNPAYYVDYLTYPSAHHLDNYQNPTFDLNFAPPEEVYYNTTVYTTDNLFTRYQEKFIKEITGRDSKIIELFVRLNANDINKLDFSKLKMINGVLFRLNSVQDYDDEIQEQTKIELIRIIEGSSPYVKTTTNPKTPSGTSGITQGGGNTGNTGVIMGGKKDTSTTTEIIKG